MSYRWLTKRGTLTFSRSGWGLGGSTRVSWPPALAFKQVASWEHAEWGMTAEIESGCRKATDSSERGISSQPTDPGTGQRWGPNWREVSPLEQIQGNSNRKEEGVGTDRELIEICSFFGQGVAMFSLLQLSVVTAKPTLGFQHASCSFSKRAVSVLQGVGVGQKLTRRRNVPSLLPSSWAGEEVLGTGKVHGQHSR